MAFPPILTFDPIPPLVAGDLAIQGDIEVEGFNNVARLTGLSTGAFSNMPSGTFFANLYTVAGPGRAFPAAIIAGNGLDYNTSIEYGPTPLVMFEGVQSFPASATTQTIELPSRIYPLDRIIFGTYHNEAAQAVTTPTGFTLLGKVETTAGEVNMYERIYDGSSSDPVGEFTLVNSVASSLLVYLWHIRFGHSTAPSEVVTQLANNAIDTSNDLGNLAPTFSGGNDTSTLWLTFIGIEADVTSPNISAFPASFFNTGEEQIVSGTAAIDGAIGWGQYDLRASALNPAAFTYGPARSGAFLVAVPPAIAGRFDVVAGGGAGWDDVLAVDNHSGANNPFVDTSQHVNFGTSAATQVTGQIRSSNAFHIHVDQTLDIQAHDNIHVFTPDAITIESTGGSTVQALSSSVVRLRSTGSVVELVSDTDNVDVIATAGDFTVTSDGVDVEAQGDVFVESVSGDITVTTNAGSQHFDASGGQFDVTTLTSIQFDAGTFVGINGFAKVTATAASTPVIGAGFGMFSVRTGTPTKPFFTDSADADFQIALLPLALTDLAAQADDTLLANISGGSAPPTAVAFTTIDSTSVAWDAAANEFRRAALTGAIAATANSNATLFAGIRDNGSAETDRTNLNFLSTTSIVAVITDDAGNDELELTWERAALTGAVTASQNSNATAFGALAAKSVLANATNASAVPAALAGSAAFQHLRVNSANTALEWSVLTAGDFPAAIIPLTALAAQAADTVVANITVGSAAPVAVPFASIDSTSIIYDATSHTFQRAAFTGAIIATQDSNATLFGGILDNGAAENNRTNLNFLSTTSNVAVVTDDAGNDELELTWERAALTGAVTASQNSNTTAFGALAAKSVLANATNASAVPAALAGSAAFQHLRVNSANTALEWSVLTAGDFPAASVPLTALAAQAADTVVANITTGSATPVAVPFASIDSTSIVYDATSHTFQRAALTGAIVATQDSNATLFGGILDNGAAENNRTNLNFLSTTSNVAVVTDDAANDELELTWERAALTGAVTASQNSNTTAFGALAAKSVLANATNASAVPAALAGTAAFQHLRVNSANTALEWSVLTAGDFPAAVVPLTALAAQAADTLVANITAGSATPVAVPFASIDSTSLIYDATTHTFQRAALTGAVTAAQDSNTTAFGSAAAKSVLANATNAGAVPAFLAGSAAFQHLRVNSANNALEWATLSGYASTSITYTSDTFQRAALTGAIAAGANANTTLFAGIRDNGTAENDRTNLNFIAGTNTSATVTDDAGNDELEIRFNVDDYPLSGLADQAANTVVANATAGSAAPTALAISTHSFPARIAANIVDYSFNSLAGAALSYDSGTGTLNVEISQAYDTFNPGTPDVVGFRKTNSRNIWWEDFDYVETNTGTHLSAGQTSWGTSIAGLGLIMTIAGVANHPGILRIRSGAVSGNAAFLARGEDGVTFVGGVLGNQVYEIEAVFRLPTVTTIRWEFGWRDVTGNNLLIFVGDTNTSANIRAFSAEAGVSAGTDTDTGLTYTANAWNVYTIRQESLGTVDYYVDGALEATHAANIPDTETGDVYFNVMTRTSASRDLELDYVHFESQQISRTS